MIMIQSILKVLVLLMLPFFSYGKVWIVSNQPGTKRNFSSIQSAVEQAEPFDTIFVKGSPMNYGNVYLEKPLILIGEGVSDESYSGYTAKLTRILFTANPFRRTVSSGSTVRGFEFPYFPGQRANLITIDDQGVVIEDITIERNWLWFVEINGNASDWVFRNNIVRGLINGGALSENERSASGFVFQNNILNSLSGLNGKLIIENNIITGRFRNLRGAQVVSNIFIREETILENVTGSVFNFNLAVGDTIGDACYTHRKKFESAFTCIGEANKGTGNRIGSDPGFMKWPADDILGGSVFILSGNSPAKRLGGREAGIFGGKYPFPAQGFIKPEMIDPFPFYVQGEEY
jgi:hypothetical protein